MVQDTEDESPHLTPIYTLPTTQPMRSESVDKWLPRGLEEWHNKYELVGHGISHEGKCGQIRYYYWACVRDGYLRKKDKFSCGRPECPICYETWASLEAKKVAHRLMAWKSYANLDYYPDHVIVSVPYKEWELSYLMLRKKVYSILKRVGIKGGMLCFHAYRLKPRCGQRSCWGCSKRKGCSSKAWEYGPHFHAFTYGFIDGRATKKIEKENGWIVENKGQRIGFDTIRRVIRYQLSHACICRQGFVSEKTGKLPRIMTVTWFGNLSYNNKQEVLGVDGELLKDSDGTVKYDHFRPEPFQDQDDYCPICHAKLVKVRWIGQEDPPPFEDQNGNDVPYIFVDPQNLIEVD
jgi:hypothetical protein